MTSVAGDLTLLASEHTAHAWCTDVHAGEISTQYNKNKLYIVGKGFRWPLWGLRAGDPLHVVLIGTGRSPTVWPQGGDIPSAPRQYENGNNGSLTPAGTAAHSKAGQAHGLPVLSHCRNSPGATAHRVERANGGLRTHAQGKVRTATGKALIICCDN